MRPLHWAKLPDVKATGTIWVDSGIDEAKAGIDTKDLEAVFGLVKQRTESASNHRASDASKTPVKKKAEKIQLVDQQRAQNISIGLTQVRLPDDQIREAILDPDSVQLSAEQVDKLLNLLPTAEEIEQVKDYVTGGGDKEQLGRVESFFLVLSDVQKLRPRVQALQVEGHFIPQWQALHDEIDLVSTACEQVRKSTAFRAVLQKVLAVGNYLNGTSNRGGAYGFKLADLSKLVQVKSGDNKTTLLHYLAKLFTGTQTLLDLKEQLASLGEAKSIPLPDKKGELSKLGQSFKQVVALFESSKNDKDPLMNKLKVFCAKNESRMSQLTDQMNSLEAKLKELAAWLGEKPNASVEDLLSPISTFVLALRKADDDNVREEEAEKRKQAAASAKAKVGNAVGGRPKGPGMMKPDANMMMEIQMKQLARAERAAQGGQSMQSVAQQQQRLLAANSHTSGLSKTGLGDGLADAAASGALYQQRRMQRMSAMHK